MKRIAAPFVSLVMMLSVATAAGAEDCRFKSDRTANFPGPVKRVVIKAEAGSLTVRGDAGSGIKAAGRACASSESLLGKITLESRREAETVYLTVMTSEGMTDMFSFKRYSYLDLDVIVPRNAELDITDGAGDIELSDVGSSRIKDGSGDMLLKNINGSLAIDDSSGEIRIITVAGMVQLADGSGNVDIEDVRGDVKIVGDGSGDIAVTKVTGNVDIVSDSSGDITVRTVKGYVKIGQDSTGDINISDVGGDFTVTVDTAGNILYDRVSGSVRIPAKT